MFDYMVKVLDNGKILVRENSTKESTVIQPREIAGYFNQKLVEELVKQEEREAKAKEIKEKVMGEGNE